MARKIVGGAGGRTQFDRKVEAFLKRGVPYAQVRGYTFERTAGDCETLTVQIFTDGLEDIEINENEG